MLECSHHTCHSKPFSADIESAEGHAYACWSCSLSGKEHQVHTGVVLILPGVNGMDWCMRVHAVRIDGNVITSNAD